MRLPNAGVRLLAAREIRTRLRSRAFVASTGISLFIVLALAVIPGLVGDDGPSRYELAVAGDRSAALAERLAAADAGRADLVVGVRVVDEAVARGLVRTGQVDAAVVDGRQVIVDDELSPVLGSLLQSATTEVARTAELVEAGVDPDTVARLLDPDALEVETLEPADEGADERQGVAFVGTVLLYGQLLGFGFWIASGLVEEKSSRVVELLLAKVRPTDVLAGKIGGIGLVAFVQLLGYAVIGLTAAQLAGTVDLPAETLGAAVLVIAWFVPGFLLYASLFAIGGALATRAEELQSTTAPVSLTAIAALLAAVTAGAQPESLLAQVASVVPLSAPLVMPVLSAAGEVTWWHALGSLLSVSLAIAGAVWLAGRVYTRGALNVRGRLRLRDTLARPL